MVDFVPLLDLAKFPMSFQLWLKSVRNQVAPVYISKTGQTASISTTNIYTTGNGADRSLLLSEGLYEVSVYHVCTSAGSAGTLTTTIGWTDDVAARTATPAANISLTGTNYASGIVIIKTLATTAVTYSTTVAGATGSPVYATYITARKIS